MRIPNASLVIPAAGESLRLPGPSRKPFRDLGGRPILIRTLEAFRGLGFIREVVLVVHPHDRGKLERHWRKRLSELKVSRLVAGGKTRAESVAFGVLATDPASRLVLVHDAARPLVTQAEVSAVAALAWRKGAAILAMPAFDTVKEVSKDGTILKTLDRNRLWLAQTPQAFRRSWILEAVLHLDPKRPPTDDAGLLEGRRPVWVVRGKGGNFKVSTPEDLARARILGNFRAP